MKATFFILLVTIFVLNLIGLLMAGNIYTKTKQTNYDLTCRVNCLENAVVTFLYLQKNKDTLSKWEQEGLQAYIENCFLSQKN